MLLFQKLLYNYVNWSNWSSRTLSKGAKTTSWIWNLHADAHISLVFFWISGMLFHGAYLSNYWAWLKDPKHYMPSAQMVWVLFGQHILNSDIGNISWCILCSHPALCSWSRILQEVAHHIGSSSCSSIWS